MDTAGTGDDVPPFQLQQLVNFTLQDDLVDQGLRSSTSIPGTTFRALIAGSAAAQRTPPPVEKVEIRCCEGFECNLYVGCSDGSLLWYALDESVAEGKGDPYALAARKLLPTRKTISRIALLPRLSKALVLSDGTLFFFLLPSLEPIPIALIPHIRGVLTFALDDNEMFAQPEDPDSAGLCVLTKRGATLYTLKERLVPIKDVTLPYRGLVAKRASDHMYIANEENYNFVDLSQGISNAFAPIPSNPPNPPPGSVPARPLIITVGEGEFLIACDGGAGSMGLFLKNGDPVRGTLEWELLPRALAVDWPYVTALLPNGTLVIHSAHSLKVVQTVELPQSVAARTLSSSYDGFYAPSGLGQNANLQLVHFTLLSPAAPAPPPKDADLFTSPADAEPSSTIDLEPPRGSGLTPPPTPPPSDPTQPQPQTTFVRSRLIVVASNGIHALLPRTPAVQAEALLAQAKWEQAEGLVEAEERKSGGAADDYQAIQFRYVRQRVGLARLLDARFTKAGESLYRGRLDPRLLVRLFPDLKGSMLGEEEEVKVFRGVREQLDRLQNVDQIVHADLVKNYAPHLKPDVDSAPAGEELKRELEVEAREMLKGYLGGVRAERGGWARMLGAEWAKVESVVDTVMVKLLAEDEDATPLYALMETSKAFDHADAERWFLAIGHYGALVRLYEMQGQEEKLLHALVRIADGVWEEDDVRDPVGRVVELVHASRSRHVVRKYGLWLLKKDPVAGLKAFIARDPKRAVKLDELSLLEDMMAADEGAGEQYLEWLVLNRRNPEPKLHDRLAQRYLKRVLGWLEDDKSREAWVAATGQYAAESPSIPVLLYFTSAPLPPDQVTSRLKLSMFLQASSLYDKDVMRSGMANYPMLQVEGAILHAKWQDHRSVLATLVYGLHDFTTAQSYCTSGGEVITGRFALSLVASLEDLKSHAQFLADGGASGKLKKQIVTDEHKKELLGILVQVQMAGGDRMFKQTCSLLNAQAVYFDLFETMSQVPPSWKFAPVSPFVNRSFRRALHERHEGQIVKGISLAQNMEASERAWDLEREEGAIIEEPAEGYDPGGADAEKADGVQFSEKPGESVPDDVVEIRVEDGDRGLL